MVLYKHLLLHNVSLRPKVVISQASRHAQKANLKNTLATNSVRSLKKIIILSFTIFKARGLREDQALAVPSPVSPQMVMDLSSLWSGLWHE